MTDDIPVMQPLKPVAKCGACGADLYAGSSFHGPDACGGREECPLRGEEWLRYQRARASQNVAYREPVSAK